MARHRAIAIVATMAALMSAPLVGASLFPNISDNSHATPQLVEFMDEYFTAKSLKNATAWLDTFDPDQVGYFDSTLGFGANESTWKELVDTLTAKWIQTAPNGRSYPLRMLGDITTGAVVYLVDTPSLFGGEVRSLSSIDFVNGKVRRQVDNWDGRGSVVLATQGHPADQYPYDLGLTGVPTVAAAEMNATATALNSALSAGDATAAAALFNYDAVFEDLTLRLRVEGQISIQAYLGRALSLLPYGPGTQLRHVLGTAQGGGYEWRPAANSTVRAGITALELDDAGNVTRFTAAWDGSRLNETQIQALAVLSVTP